MSFLSALLGGANPNVINGAKARAMVEAGAVLVDVRSPGEFSGGHLPDALNIPVSELRARLGELDPGRPTVLYCRSGARSGNATRVLLAAGFQEVKDLGPMTAW